MAQRWLKWPLSACKRLLHMSFLCPVEQTNAFSFLFRAQVKSTRTRTRTHTRTSTIPSSFCSKLNSNCQGEMLQHLLGQRSETLSLWLWFCLCPSMSPLLIDHFPRSVWCVPFPLYWNLLCCANKILKISYLICISRRVFLCSSLCGSLWLPWRALCVHFDAVLMGTSSLWCYGPTRLGYVPHQS